MEAKELGPCPLCGGEIIRVFFNFLTRQEIVCQKCRLIVLSDVWDRISALAEQNRRRGEALERCRAMRARGDATGGHACLFSALLGEVERICEEALK